MNMLSRSAAGAWSSSATAWPAMRAVEEILTRAAGRVPHHRVRRRAARQLQPHHAVAGAGRRKELDDIVINSREWYEENNIELVTGDAGRRSIAATSTVTSASGHCHPTTGC